MLVSVIYTTRNIKVMTYGWSWLHKPRTRMFTLQFKINLFHTSKFSAIKRTETIKTTSTETWHHAVWLQVHQHFVGMNCLHLWAGQITAKGKKQPACLVYLQPWSIQNIGELLPDHIVLNRSTLHGDRCESLKSRPLFLVCCTDFNDVYKKAGNDISVHWIFFNWIKTTSIFPLNENWIISKVINYGCNIYKHNNHQNTAYHIMFPALRSYSRMFYWMFKKQQNDSDPNVTVMNVVNLWCHQYIQQPTFSEHKMALFICRIGSNIFLEISMLVIVNSNTEISWSLAKICNKTCLAHRCLSL
jgi:hypothetical protein